MLPCLHLTRLSSAVEPSSSLVWASNRSLRWRSSSRSANRACGTRWPQADADDSGGTDSRLRAAEKTELAQLRRDQRRLEMENEILQRAAA